MPGISARIVSVTAVYISVTTRSEETEITIHREMPSRKGLKPTSLTLCTERPQPIRKRVEPRAFLANPAIPAET